jgi:hypothetical protein
MTTPSFTPVPAAQDRAVRAQLGEQAQAVTGDPAAAGIFGDVAGRSEPPHPMDLSKAERTNVDTDALLAAIQAQQEQINQLLADAEQARVDNLPKPPDPMAIEPQLGNASGEINAAFAGLHRRLLRVEEAAGIDAAQELADAQAAGE